MEYNLNLSENEVNKILDTLSKLPYSEVFTLIDKIHSQAVSCENKLYEKLKKEEEEFIKWKEDKDAQDENLDSEKEENKKGDDKRKK